MMATQISKPTSRTPTVRGARQPEEQALLAKVVVVLSDYALAVRRFGPKFWEQDQPPCNNKCNDWKIYRDGVEAHQFFFGGDVSDDFSFLNLCVLFGINNQVIRHRLREMTPEGADDLVYQLLKLGES